MWLTCSKRCVQPLGQERIRGWNRLSHEKFVGRVVRVLEGEKEKEAAEEAQNRSVASIAGLARRLGMKEEHVALAFSAVEESSHPKYRRMFAALPVPEDMLSAGCRVVCVANLFQAMCAAPRTGEDQGLEPPVARKVRRTSSTSSGRRERKGGGRRGSESVGGVDCWSGAPTGHEGRARGAGLQRSRGKLAPEVSEDVRRSSSPGRYAVGRL